MSSKGGRRQTGSRSQRDEPRAEVGALRHAIGDCVVTCLWVAVSSLFAELAEHLHAVTDVSEDALNIALLVAGLALLAPVCALFWGAIINPSNNVALIVRGKGGVGANLLRMLGQLSGAFVGCYIAVTLVPHHHQGKFHMLSGKLRDGVTMELGFACEAALVLLINLFFLYSVDHGSESHYKDSTVVALLPHAMTVLVCVIGAEFTGPSLNPYLSFAWNLVYKQHSMTEHVVVFWLGPLAGAVLAGIVWRWLAPSGAATAASTVGGRTSRDRAAGKAAARALASQGKKAQ